MIKGLAIKLLARRIVPGIALGLTLGVAMGITMGIHVAQPSAALLTNTAVGAQPVVQGTRPIQLASQVRTLEEVLAVVRQAVPGRVLKADMKRRGPRLVFIIRVLDLQGRVREVVVDAETAVILNVRGN